MKRTIQSPLLFSSSWKINLQLVKKLFLLASWLLFQANIFAQCNNLTCKSDTIPVYLAANCQVALDPSIFIKTPPTDCPGSKFAQAFDALNFPIGTINNTYVNQILKVTVFDISSGKKCDAKILVKDTMAPILVCQSDITVHCNLSIAPADLPAPIAVDNCGGFLTPVNTDVVINNPCPVPDVVLRTWKATDASGNTKTCLTKITLKRPLLSDVMFTLASNFILPCDVDPDNLTVLKQPTIDGNPIELNGYCNFKAVKTDSIAPAVLPLMGVTYFRTWKVTDECLNISVTALQVFTVEDTQAPTITCPPDVTFESTPNFCPNPIVLQNAVVTDNCLSNPKVIVDWPFGDYIGAYSNIPNGSYTVIYSVTDYAKNTSTCSFNLTMIDTIAPVAVCKGEIVIALSNVNPAILMPSSVDNGSYDNCSIVSILLDRLDDAAPYQPFLSFNCNDVGDTILVNMKVTDLGGLMSICQTKVIVQDKIAPFIICPKDATTECTTDFGDFSQFGDITVSDPCLDTVIVNITNNLNNCQVGNFKRTFTAIDAAGNSSVCTQTITVVNSHPFDGSLIVWPLDTTSNACILPDNFDPEDLPPPYNYPVLPNTDPCALIAVNHEDHLFTVSLPSCYKIMRIWKVIDWCQFDPLVPNKGVWTHTQMIKIQDDVAPVLNCPPLVKGSVGPDCKTGMVIMPPITATDCNPNVKITNNSPYSLVKGADASGIYPVGITKVTFTANDGCGNFSTCIVQVSVSDDKKPTPICKFGLATDLVYMGVPGPMSLVPAIAFNSGSIDNCTPANKLIFSYSQDTSDTKKIFTCDDKGKVDIQVWVTDLNGNQDYCVTFIDVQDNMFPCPIKKSKVYIAGKLVAENDQEIENVNVELSGSTSKDLITKQDGAFMFDQLPMGQAFEVVPVKNDDPLNGISTIDLIQIQNHVLGKKLLSSPYKILAADVDGSKKITTADVVLLKKLILHMISAIPGQTSWKFIDKNYKFPNPANPWQEDFPVKFADSHLMEDKPTVDFIGIKMGDVNNNAVNKITGENEVRTQHEVLPISFEDKVFKAGDLVTCQLNLASSDQLTDLQFSLDINTDKAELIKYDPDFRNNFSENDLYYDVNSKKLHLSWFKSEGASFTEDPTIVNLQFRAKMPGSLMELIKICDKDNKPEALTTDQQLKIPVLQANEAGSLVPKFTLFQNKPNPFSKNTVISFNLPEPGNAIVRVMDVTGKVIFTKTQQYTEGYQEVNIDSNQLTGPGVYIYSVETAKNTAMARMILLQ